MARIGTRISNVSDVRPDRRGKLEARAIGLGDGRMLSVGTSIDTSHMRTYGELQFKRNSKEEGHGRLRLAGPLQAGTGSL